MCANISGGSISGNYATMNGGIYVSRKTVVEITGYTCSSHSLGADSKCSICGTETAAKLVKYD